MAILAKQLDGETSDSLAPLVDDIASATARIREIDTKIDTLRRLEEQHDRLDEQSSYIKGLQDAQAMRRGKLGSDFTLEPEEDVLAQLNTTFQNIVMNIGLPHATGRARLDPATLLPLVDEQTFSQRGGGARVAVSVAYSLALLTYTLEREFSQLPSLLMIDSPQKNFGANKDDKALSHRVYEQFLNNMAERHKLANSRFSRPFQLIIVDNDIPADIRRRVRIISFSRESGFIQNLSDPHSDPSGYEQLMLDERS